ncbi:MAG: PAS domain-containing sensor histidine kinase [Bacteroidetes bacterium]|nr:MAG: PAS domain-containing sensor histidine kinase [Bacteroidota bacterium]
MQKPQDTSIFDKLTSNVPGVIFQFRISSEGSSSMPYANERLKDVFEVDPAEVLIDATPVFNKVHPEDLANLHKSIKVSRETLQDWVYEFRIIRSDGEIRWISGVSRPEKNRDKSMLWYGYILDVTEKKKVEQLNSETKIKYQGYFENATDGLFVVNKEGNYLEANPAACKMTGYSIDELLTMKVKDLVEPDFLHQKGKTLERTFELGSIDEEVLLRRKSGETFWVRLVTSLINESTAIAFCHDITQRKHQQTLLEMQLGFQKLIASISSGFVNATINSFDSAVNYALGQCGIFFNADRCYVFLFSPDYKFMSNTHEWCAPDIKPQIDNLQNFRSADAQWWWAQIREKKIINLHDVNNHTELSDFEKSLFKEQEVKSLLSIPMINNGLLVGFFGLDRVKICKGWNQQDITQFNLVAEILSSAISKSGIEEKLRKSENRYRLLAENARDVIFRLEFHPHKSYEYVSPSSVNLNGYSPEDYYADNQLEGKIIHPDDYETVRDYYQNPAGFDRPLVMRMICKNGEQIWCEQSNVPFFNDEGALVAIEGIARDITGQKELENKLRELNAQLLQKKRDLEVLNLSLEKRIAAEVDKNRELDHLMALQARQASMGEMIANIAHQWRQPLNFLSLALYDLSDAFDYEELDRSYLDNTVEEMTRVIQEMSGTIDDFRDFFKPQNEKTEFKVADIINRTFTFMAPYFANAGVELHKDILQEIMILGYSTQLEQVIINILKNALDSQSISRPDKREISVRTKLTDSSVCLIEIANTGSPVNEEDFPRLFDPYFTTKPQGQGLGLGLYVSRIIVEKNMGGKIYCENTDRGVKFVLELTSIANTN